MNHEQAKQIVATLNDNIQSYGRPHIEAVTPLILGLDDDPMEFKQRADIKSKNTWGILFDRAKEVGVEPNTMATIYRKKLESDFKYMYGSIRATTANKIPGDVRPNLSSEPQRYALVHGLIGYIKKDIDYNLIPDHIVNELFNDIIRRYYTEVCKDGTN